MDNKERKVLEEAGLLYPTPNCVEYYQIVKATADEVVQRIFEAMSDYVQVVRCKDCIHNSVNRNRGNAICDLGIGLFQLYDYCSEGERREDDT